MERFFKRKALNFLRSKGRALDRYPLAEYLDFFSVDCVVDVGANVGQYGDELRSIGFTKTIESFEPLPMAFEQLKKNTETDSKWLINEFALGAVTTSLPINIGKANATSSLLPTENSDIVEYVGEIQVDVRTIDEIYEKKFAAYKNPFLKIDTQGFEKQVIQGAKNKLENFVGIQMEVSLDPIYSGETLIEGMIFEMRSKGFSPWWICSGFRTERPLRLMQVDLYFINSNR